MTGGEGGDAAPGGLKSVFLEIRPMLSRLLAARLGSVADAEDGLQDMWLKLDGLAVRPIADPAAYLYRMAANLAADRRVAQARSLGRDGAWLAIQPAPDELPGIERALLGSERLRAVEAALAAMPPRMSAALKMFRIEALPQRDIADRLGISVSGVEKLLQRAYRAIGEASEDSRGPRRLYDEGDVT